MDRLMINASSNVAMNIICDELNKKYGTVVCEYELKDIWER